MRTLKDITKEETDFFDMKLDSCMRLFIKNLAEVSEYCKRNDLEPVFSNYVELALANLVHGIVDKDSMQIFLNRVMQAYCVGLNADKIPCRAKEPPSYIG